jgi:hypothetical protein
MHVFFGSTQPPQHVPRSQILQHAGLRFFTSSISLGFLVGLAAEVASTHEKFRPALEPLQQAETRLERARLAREDTLCRESMTGAERRWLSNNRSPLARHWNLLTGLTVDQLPYAN